MDPIKNQEKKIRTRTERERERENSVHPCARTSSLGDVKNHLYT